MEESSVYQKALSVGRREGRSLGLGEGALQEARKLLVLAGRNPLGPPNAKTRKAIEGITDLARLEGMVERIHEVKDWPELLATLPGPATQGRRPKHTKES